MYIASIRIQNYRCFKDTTIEFQPGLNVIIGENNAGKTTLLRALALVFDRRRRSRPGPHDFCNLAGANNGSKAPDSAPEPPKITVAVTLRSSATDTEADRALVASWLTGLQTTWEAQLTYAFFLPEAHLEEYHSAAATAKREDLPEVLEEFLPKYVSRIYGGNPDTLLTADPESLSKFDCQSLDALRDVESEMFAGSNPLLRSMLEQVLDLNKKPEDRRSLRTEFRENSTALRDLLVKRLDTSRLFELVASTGAGDAGDPKLQGTMTEEGFIAALRLFIAREQFSFPVTHNGLGYNNLLYISLVLASLASRVSKDRLGQNAAIFPMLLIEEPEAHLHPALQYKLLAHLAARVEGEPNINRQVFVTSHSTHITAAAKLKSITCLSIRGDGRIGVSYPARVFPDTPEGHASCGYVERYLDATKSSMLFAKAVVFVEGIAEQLVVPAFARLAGRSFDEHHVEIIRVDGITFKHFLPLFGAGATDIGRQCALDRRVACVVDADPARLKKKSSRARWKSCFPFELNTDKEQYDYRPQSHAVEQLQTLASSRDNVKVFPGVKTFEYDLALANSACPDIITPFMDSPDAVKALMTEPSISSGEGDGLEDDEELALSSIPDVVDRHRQRVAAIYLRSAEGSKGEHAFALQESLRGMLAAKATQTVKCPEYIRLAIEWVTPNAARPSPPGNHENSASA